MKIKLSILFILLLSNFHAFSQEQKRKIFAKKISQEIVLDG